MELNSDNCTELSLNVTRMKFNPIIFTEVLIISYFFTSLEARDKYIKVEKVNSCVKAENLAIQIITSETNPDFKKNIVYLNSTIEVRKKLQGTIQMVMILNRCTLKDNKCSLYTTIVSDDICAKMNQKYMFFSHYIEVWEPDLRCPLFGNYSVQNARVDLTVPLALISGSYRWLMYFKFFAVKSREMVSCFTVQLISSDRIELIRKMNLTNQ